MKDLIQKMLAKLAELKQQANEALTKLKPMEQQEAAQEMAWVFRAGRNCLENLNEISSMAEGKLQEYAEELKVKAKEEVKADEAFRQELAKDVKILEAVKQSLLASGDLVTKTDMEGKVQAAETAKETATRLAVQAEIAEQQKGATRRGEAETAIAEVLKAKLGDGAAAVAKEVAAKLTDEKLKADGYKTEIAATVARVKKCVEVGVTKSETLQECASMEDAAFTKIHGGWQEVAEAAGKGKSKAPLSSPAAPGKPGATDAKPKRLMV